MSTVRKRGLIGGAALAVAGLGAALVLTASAPAMARDDDDFGERCGAAADTTWQPLSAVSQKLEAEGYTEFLRVERDDGCYEVIARKGDAAPEKLWLNPASLEITGFSKIPPKHFRPHRHDRAGKDGGFHRHGDRNAPPPATEQQPKPQAN